MPARTKTRRRPATVGREATAIRARQQPVAHVVDATRNTARGLAAAWAGEAAFRIEAIALLAALPAGLFLAPGVAWYAAMVGSLLVLLAVELLNTAVEKLADHVTPVPHPDIGRIKDYGSAAVGCAIALAGLVWLAALAVRAGLL
jgi:diacylglycerol kinase (ATP)